ncbi:MAG: ATPase, T2SS/T4P/T4SS family [Thermoplasmata archaeon]
MEGNRKSCKYSTKSTEGHRKIIFECRNCESSFSFEDCLSNIIKALQDEYNIDSIVFKDFLEKKYQNEGVELLKLLTNIVDDLDNFTEREPIKDECKECELNPNDLFFDLRETILKDPADLFSSLQNSLKKKDRKNGCRDCIDELDADFEILIRKVSQLRKMVLTNGFGIVEDRFIINPNSSELQKVNTKRIKRGIKKIMNNNKEIKPDFSNTWLDMSIPKDSKKIKKYTLNGCDVVLYNLLEETEDLYHIILSEYELDQDMIKLISLTKKSLLKKCPRDVDLSDQKQIKKYITNKGKKIIRDLSNNLEVELGDDRKEKICKTEEIVRYLKKYTSGYGIMETLLLDDRVEDIFIDAPAHSNNVYLNMTNIKGLSKKCKTNIFLSKADIDNIISRFRLESGKPFSEANPIIESNLKEYNTRVTAIGSPLSKEGTAIALRKRMDIPWTLPRLIRAGSLTPLAAGLLSFLVDGDSTLLIAGSRGAGKTTLLGALMMEFPKSQRILTIEDTNELPISHMQEEGYNIQSMTVNTNENKNDLNTDDALKVSLRMGESALVLGEVRGKETKTLYEAMRSGTAGSSVLGTIHGNTPNSVYERVVHDMNIPKESFSATDFVIITGIIRPGGGQKTERRLTHISEYTDQQFEDVMNFNKEFQPTDHFKRNSKKIGEIAKLWGLSYRKAVENIKTRGKIKKKMVEVSIKKNDPTLLNPSRVASANDKFWNLISKFKDDYSTILSEWNNWYDKRMKYE